MLSKEADAAKDTSEINFFLRPHKGEWLPDGQTEIPVHRLPKEKKKRKCKKKSDPPPSR